MRTIRPVIVFVMLIPFVCSAQKAHRVSAGEAGPSAIKSGKAYRLEEALSDNVAEYNRNKAFSLDEETKEDAYKNEVSVTVGAAIPCAPFASYMLDDVVQGAKTGFNVRANYTIWFVKNVGFEVNFGNGYFGYDFSKVPPYNPSEGEIDVKISKKTGWDLITFGISLRTKLPLYQNSVFLTGRVLMQYGMLSSPVERVSYKTESLNAEGEVVYRKGSAVIFPQFISHKLVLGGGIGVKVRVKKRLYVVTDLDYNYAISNNTKTKLVQDGRTRLFSDFSAFSVGAGIAYAF